VLRELGPSLLGNGFFVTLSRKPFLAGLRYFLLAAGLAVFLTLDETSFDAQEQVDIVLLHALPVTL